MNSDHKRRDGERQLSKLINLKKAVVRLVRDYEVDNQEVIATVDRNIHELTIELERYKDLSRGRHISDFQILQDLSKLPRILIEGRIVLRLTQKEFAKQVGLTQAQISCYEKSGYAKIKLSKALEIADLVHRELNKGKKVCS